MVCPVNEKLRVCDAAVLPEFTRTCVLVSVHAGEKSCVEYEIRLEVNRGKEPDVFALRQSNLSFIKRSTLRFSGERFVVVVTVRSIPLPDCVPSIDAEPGT